MKQAKRLAARVNGAGQIDTQFWGNYRDELEQRWAYLESGEAAHDGFRNWQVDGDSPDDHSERWAGEVAAMADGGRYED